MKIKTADKCNKKSSSFTNTRTLSTKDNLTPRLQGIRKNMVDEFFHWLSWNFHQVVWDTENSLGYAFFKLLSSGCQEKYDRLKYGCFTLGSSMLAFFFAPDWFL